jgi:hypothetical protein
MKLTYVWMVGLALFAFAGSAGAQKGRKKTKGIPEVKKKIKQYKKNNRDRITDMVKDRDEQVIKYFNAFLDVHKHDLEAYYGLALAYARTGEMDKAMANVKLALKHGLPFERFQAGPRTLAKPLYDHAAFQELAKTQSRVLLHGPLLGSLTDTSVTVWFRVQREMPVKVVVFKSGSSDFSNQVEGKILKDRDFTARVRMSGLKPDTDYT